MKLNKYTKNNPFSLIPYDAITARIRLHGTVHPVGRICTVVAFVRNTMDLIGSTMARPDGTWEIIGNECAEESIFVTCLDEVGEFNSDTFDRCSQSAVSIPFNMEQWIDPLLHIEYQLVPLNNLFQFNAVSEIESMYGIDYVSVDADSNVTMAKDSIIQSGIPALQYRTDSGLPISASKAHKQHLRKYTGKLPLDVLGDGSCVDVYDFVACDKNDRPYVTPFDFGASQRYERKPIDGFDFGGRFLSGVSTGSDMGGIDYAMFLPPINKVGFTFSFILYPVVSSIYSTVSTNDNYFIRIKEPITNVDLFSVGATFTTLNLNVLPSGAGNVKVTTTAKIDMETAHHFTVSITPTHILIWKNGVLNVNTPYTTTPQKYTNNGLIFIFGFDYTYAGYWMCNPVFANIRFFNKVLNDTEAQTVYDSDFGSLDMYPFVMDTSIKLLDVDNTIHGVCQFKTTPDYYLEFNRNKFITYTDNLNTNAALSFGGVEFGTEGIVLAGISTLHNAISTTTVDSSTALASHDVSVYVKFKALNVSSAGVQTLYKSGDNINGISIYIENSKLCLIGVNNTVAVSVALSDFILSNGQWYIAVYTDGVFSLYNIEYDLLSSTAISIGAGGPSTDQQAVGSSAGTSVLTGTVGASEYFTGVIKKIGILAKDSLYFSAKEKRKVYVEDTSTLEMIPVTVDSIDPVNSSAEMYIHVPELSNSQDKNLRMYISPDFVDNPIAAIGAVAVPSGVSADWDMLQAAVVNDTACEYNIRKQYNTRALGTVAIPYVSYNFLPYRYELSGRNKETVTRVSDYYRDANVRLNIRYGDAHKPGYSSRFYCEFILGDNVEEVGFGVLHGATWDNSFNLDDLNIRLAANIVYLLCKETETLTPNYVCAPEYTVPLIAGTVLRILVDCMTHKVYLGVNNLWYHNSYQSNIFTENIQYEMNSIPLIMGSQPFVSLKGVNASGTFLLNRNEFKYPPADIKFDVLGDKNIVREFGPRHASLYLAPSSAYASLIPAHHRAYQYAPGMSSAIGTYFKYTNVQYLDRTIPAYNINADANNLIRINPAAAFYPNKDSFTLDFIFCRYSQVNEALFGSFNSDGTSGIYVYIMHGVLEFRYSPAPDVTPISIQCSTNINDYIPHHFAMCYEAGTLYLFLDGNLELVRDINTGLFGTSVYNTSFGVGCVGVPNSYSAYFNGWISMFRVYNNVCRWKTNFDPADLLDEYIPDTLMPVLIDTVLINPENESTPIFECFGRSSNAYDNKIVNIPIAAHGKYYIEFNRGSIVGICNYLFNTSANSTLGLNPEGNDIAVSQTYAHPVYKGITYDIDNLLGSVSALSAAGAGSRTIGIAIDTVNEEIYTRYNGAWYAGISPDIAATGLLDIDLSQLFNLPLFPCVYLASANTYTSITLDSKDFVFAPPVGYSDLRGNIAVDIFSYNPIVHNASIYLENYAKASGQLASGYYPINALKPWNMSLLFRSNIQYSAWIMNAGTGIAKFNIEARTPFILNRLFLLNYRIDDYGPANGIKEFTLYGTNSITAFDNVDYSNLDNLTFLGDYTALPYSIREHGQVFKVDNSTPFLYYVLRIHSNHGGPYLGFHYIELQRYDEVVFSTNAILYADIDSTKVEVDSLNVPVKIRFGSDSGVTAYDTESFMGYIGNDYTKLNILDEYGNSLSTEVVAWDLPNRKAELWVKIPKVYGNNREFVRHAILGILYTPDAEEVFTSAYDAPLSYRILGNIPFIPDYDVSVNGIYGFRLHTTGGTELPEFSIGTALDEDELCMGTYMYYRAENVGIESNILGLMQGTGYSEFGLTVKNGTVQLFHRLNGLIINSVYVDTGMVVQTETLYHFAMSRRNGVLYGFCDGVLIGTVKYDRKTPYGCKFYVGNEYGKFIATGCTFIMPFFVKGYHVWVHNFPVPTEFPMEQVRNTRILFTKTGTNANIGAIGTAPAMDVWDDFIAVAHLRQQVNNTIPMSTGTGATGVISIGTLTPASFDGVDYLYFDKLNNSLLIDIPAALEYGPMSAFMYYKFPPEVTTTYQFSNFIGFNSAGMTYDGGMSISPHTTFAGGIYQVTSNYGAIPNTSLVIKNNKYEYPNLIYLSQDEFYYESGSITETYDVNAAVQYQDLVSTYYYVPIYTNAHLDVFNGAVSDTIGAYVSEVMIHKQLVSPNFYALMRATIEDMLCVFNVINAGSIVEGANVHYADGAIVDIRIPTGWMSSVVQDFPLKLVLDSSCGISNTAFTNFFKCLAYDAEVEGSFIHDYDFTDDSKVLSDFYVNNIGFGSNPNADNGSSIGVLFNGSAYDAKRAVQINGLKKFDKDITVGVRIKLDTIDKYTYSRSYILCGRFLDHVNPYPSIYIKVRKIREAETYLTIEYGYTGWSGSARNQVVGIEQNCVLLGESTHTIVVTREFIADKYVWRTKLYLDSVDNMLHSFDTDGSNTPYALPHGKFDIGGCAFSSNGYTFIGSIEAFMAEDSVLSAPEIEAFMNQSLCTPSVDITQFSTALISQDYTIPQLKGSPLTSVDIIYTETAKSRMYVAVTFDHRSYQIYEDDAWKVVVTDQASIHGAVDGDWYYLDGDTFIAGGDKLTAISSAFGTGNYAENIKKVSSWDFASSQYDALTGVCDISFTFTFDSMEKYEASSYIQSVGFNNKVIKILDPISLEKYSSKINSIQIHSIYEVNEFIDISTHLQVYCKLSNSDDWVLCSFDVNIPMITAAMNTVGLWLHVKVEAHNDIVPYIIGDNVAINIDIM